MHSYNGRVLHVDLTDRKTHVEEVDAEFFKKYLGGVGLATRVLYDNTKPGIDPLSPESVQVFATSAFAGTIIPTGNKHGVADKSPLTGFIGDSLATSFFSHTLKRTGYDALVVKGKSDKPIYLFIDDDIIQFRDASQMWGKLGCFETEEAIRAELRDDTVRVCSIGAAGENLVRYACIGNDRGRQAGRCGPGAVMGSKNLKAIAVRGTKPIKVANLEALRPLCVNLTQKTQGPTTVKYRLYGTPTNVLTLNGVGSLPTRNYQQTTFEGAEKVSGEYMLEHYVERVVACSGCSIACEHILYAKEGPYTGARASMDYETLYALGPLWGVDYFPAIIKAAELCDSYGLDSMSTGVTIAWAMECFEKGLLSKSDFGGLEPSFGNHEAGIALIGQVANREGIGNLLAEGVKRAAAEVGKGSDHFAMHVKGLEFPGYDPRSLQTLALGMAVGTRGPCHNRSAAYEPDMGGKVDRLKGEKGRGILAAEQENYAAVFDSLVLCKFIRRCFDDFFSEGAQLYSLVTGIDMSPDELRQAGERIWNLKKAFNIREGWTKADDWLPPRALKDPIPSGVAKGVLVKEDELRIMIDDYYEARGWTKEGLIPKQKLIELGLEDIADEIGVDTTLKTGV